VFTENQLQAIRGLEATVIANDGGRLKLEFGVLTTRTALEVEDLLYWDGTRLVGFAGLYGSRETVEVAGMVDPEYRGRGIGAALLDASLALCRARPDCARVLLVAPRTSAAAVRLATSRGGTFEHAEHALELTGEVPDGPRDSTIEQRTARPDDLDDLSRLLADAFGRVWLPTLAEHEDVHEPTLVAERDGHVLATMRLHKSDDGWGVYGFAVEGTLRGQGIGRDLLRRVCQQAKAEGVGRVHLEVSVENDRALGLYLSLGFVHEATEDYYLLPLGSGVAT
jgi:ribosomal protein S18 acetylase RimI-like enzyme